MSTPATELPNELVKICCAQAYEHDLVSLILGDSYHPGGLKLTRHLAATLELKPGQRVVDVAAGPGASALLLASEFEVHVDGVDLGEATVAAANERAAAGGVAGAVRFRLGDAESLPLPDAHADAVICECAFCTFPGKEQAATEMARVLRPGGRLGLTDVVLDPERLDPELRSLAGWVACIADARPEDDYRAILEAAGLHVDTVERHDTALARMVEQVESRLAVLRMTETPLLSGVDWPLVDDRLARAKQAVDDGVAGYVLMTAVKT